MFLKVHIILNALSKAHVLFYAIVVSLTWASPEGIFVTCCNVYKKDLKVYFYSGTAENIYFANTDYIIL